MKSFFIISFLFAFLISIDTSHSFVSEIRNTETIDPPLFKGGDSIHSVFGKVVLGVTFDESSLQGIRIFAITDSHYHDEIEITDNCSPNKDNKIDCELVLTDLSLGVHTIALYHKHEDQNQAYLFEGSPHNIKMKGPKKSYFHKEEEKKTNRVDSPLVGIYYTTLNQPSAVAAQEISKYLGRPAYNLEDVLRSDGKLLLADIVTKYLPKINWTFSGEVNWYQDTPDLGYYCLYRKREGEKGIFPDCVNISHTLEVHASELVSAGVDYIVFDATNWGKWPDEGSDVRQMRPTEVVFEEWLKLRKKGIKTPQLVVWNRIQGDDNLWIQYLDRIYNNADYDDMILKKNGTEFKIFMVPYHYEELNLTSVRALEYNGGRENIISIYNWVADGYDPSFYANGIWTYLSGCTAMENGKRIFTTSVDRDRECNGIRTTNSPLGSVWTVSAQSALCNMPFFSPGKLNGLYFKKQFGDVFKVKSDNIFIPSFNELEIIPKATSGWGLNNTYVYSMGLQNDPDRFNMFIDGYGSERNRAIEPTVYNNGYYLKLMASCLRVAAVSSVIGSADCSVANEECCVINANETFNDVWSLQKTDMSDAIISSRKDEVDSLINSGDYVELANPWPAPTDFAYNESLPWNPWNNYDVLRGPFLLYNQSLENPLTAELWRCVGGGKHFFGLDCKLPAKKEYLLGYVSLEKNSVTARSLRSCFSTSGFFYHALDGVCKPPDSDDGIVGYVF